MIRGLRWVNSLQKSMRKRKLLNYSHSCKLPPLFRSNYLKEIPWLLSWATTTRLFPSASKNQSQRGALTWPLSLILWKCTKKVSNSPINQRKSCSFWVFRQTQRSTSAYSALSAVQQMEASKDTMQHTMLLPTHRRDVPTYSWRIMKGRTDALQIVVTLTSQKTMLWSTWFCITARGRCSSFLASTASSCWGWSLLLPKFLQTGSAVKRRGT